jgi:sec-independent protein translocase protein TatB
MPSFQDSALLIFLALLLFGPKKLPELARQLGKLMSEFRRASNEFRMQMEEELRIADPEEQRKKIAAMEAAAPVAPAITEGTENTIAPPVAEEFLVGHPHEQPQTVAPTSEPLPIATSGDLNLMPPSTGLPVSNSALSPVLDSIPHDPDPETVSADSASGEVTHRG